jgi:hypothetical protein
MKNEEMIMKTRIRLMNSRVIGTTGNKMEVVDADGVVTEIDEPEEIHTYVGWKRRGYQVPQGTKAKVFIPIWNYSTDEEGNTTMFQRNAPFFTPSQVEKIVPQDVEEVETDTVKELSEELIFA